MYLPFNEALTTAERQQYIEDFLSTFPEEANHIPDADRIEAATRIVRSMSFVAGAINSGFISTLHFSGTIKDVPFEFTISKEQNNE